MSTDNPTAQKRPRKERSTARARWPAMLEGRSNEPTAVDLPTAESIARYRNIFEYCNDAIFVIDPAQDQILDVNPRACTMLGYSRKALLATPISVVHPDEMPRMLAFTDRVFQQGHGWTNELTCRTSSGECLPAEISASVIEVDGKNFIIAMVRNIAERKRAEEALRVSEERLGRIVESAMDAILAIDDRLHIVLFNRAAEAAFRCGAATALGTSFVRFLSERFKRLLDESIKAFDTSGWSAHYLWAEGLTAFRCDGEAFPVDVTVSPFSVDGRRHLTIVLRDIALRRRAEIELRQLRRENARLHEVVRSHSETADIVGKSAAMNKALREIECVAATDSTVLILGETGTGKEVIARCVHRLSRRKDSTLVTLNCACLSPSLIESELFGHEKGAFTGALTRKLGRFELADQGTLFLDEIGELPLDLQVKLLRVLQEGEFERVGGSSTRKVDVRVIAATNRNLKKEVAEGRFRADLYYRLNVFPVCLPPLRERPEDIPLLTHYFVMKYGKKIGRPIGSISPQVVDILREYAWPGNIRELEHVIERGVILSHEGRLELGDWLPLLSPKSPVTRGIMTLETLERGHIMEVLELSGWRVSGKRGAAQRLGIKPTTLEARMRKLGIQRPR